MGFFGWVFLGGFFNANPGFGLFGPHGSVVVLHPEPDLDPELDLNPE